MTAGNLAAGQPPRARDPRRPYRVCVVCLGNICRSPMAEVVLREELASAGLAGKVAVESAGTGDWHLGEAMDPRARAELNRHGYDGTGHEARQIQQSWLADYDLLLAMDHRNLASLRNMAAGDEELADRMMMMRSFDPDSGDGAEIRDPYYGNADDYAEVFELVQAAARGLAKQLAAVL